MMGEEAVSCGAEQVNHLSTDVNALFPCRARA